MATFHNYADDDQPYERVKIENLLLDGKNPRLAEYAMGNKPTQSELVKILWQKMAVDELVMSIAARGYFPHEPLFAIKEGNKYLVIEGNRRLAAVMLLLDADLRNRLKITDLPRISSKQAKDLSKLPVVVTTREKLWQYLGFKHVNGPAKWGSYAKAQYIAEVREVFKVALEAIAEQIGDKNRTVQRLYRAMMVIRQAEDAGVFKRENRFKKSFSFSHLYTGLDYEGFKRFLNLKDESAESPRPVPNSRMDELGELCRWLYGDKKGKDGPVRPLIESQNPDLAILEQVLRSDDAITTLRNGLPLQIAHDVSMGDERLFRQALQDAKLALQKATGTLTTGFTKEQHDLMRTAREIADIADDLVAQMERKSTPRKRRNAEVDDDV
jgi:hypothetical protein